MEYLAGIDLGSTSLKVTIYDIEGNAVAQASRPTERFNPYEDHPDWAIWKPEQIWGGVAQSVKEAISKIDHPKNIKGVAGLHLMPIGWESITPTILEKAGLLPRPKV